MTLLLLPWWLTTILTSLILLDPGAGPSRHTMVVEKKPRQTRGKKRVLGPGTPTTNQTAGAKVKKKTIRPGLRSQTTYPVEEEEEEEEEEKEEGLTAHRDDEVSGGGGGGGTAGTPLGLSVVT